jgi:hypothetical protein
MQRVHSHGDHESCVLRGISTSFLWSLSLGAWYFTVFGWRLMIHQPLPASAAGSWFLGFFTVADALRALTYGSYYVIRLLIGTFLEKKKKKTDQG